MSEFFKNKRRLALAMGALFLIVTLVSGTVAYYLSDNIKVFLGRTEASEPESQAELPVADSNAEDPEAVPVAADPQPPEIKDEPVQFHTPSEMRGVFLAPGVDYLLTKSPTQDSVKKEIDAALQNAKDLTMNTVIIATDYDSKVIYHTSGADSVLSDFDVMDYIVNQCRSLDLYTYGIFDVSRYQENSPVGLMAVGAKSISRLTLNLKEFSEAYALDGILIDGYVNQQADKSYSVYQTLGGGIGFDNFMRQSPEAVVKTASRTIRSYARNTQVGLLTDAVWENAEANELGSNTKATFTSLGDGNADTKSFVEEELVDFVAVKAYTCLTDTAQPFKEVVGWWADVASENSIPLYVVHASENICTEKDGWEPHDQITKQVIEASGFGGYRGSVFNNLQRLVENPKEASTTLIKYYNNEVQAAHILTELAITKPEKTTFETFEPIVNFVGASDPNSLVTINGEEVVTDASGYFTVTIDLVAGENTFVIEHKEKTIKYSITRQVQILKEMSPAGSVTTEGGMAISISATAYADATVYAVINGQTVNLTIDESMETETERDSTFKRFVGEYTAPAAGSSEQNLGSIVVYGTWEGETDSIEGASVKVNKKAKIEDGVPVVITAAQAKTYPPDTLNNIAYYSYYPLPAGAMDYAVGDEIVYKNAKGETSTYFVLASGLRVEAKNLSTSGEFASGNAVSAASITSDSGYTYLTLKTAQKVSYIFGYTASAITIKLNYTTQVPGSVNVGSNPLFTGASWKDATITLPLTKSGGFMGYKGYFDDEGNLVFRFNNPPSSVANARIAIDPGHGGSDRGTSGFLADYSEKVLNLAIAQKLADTLESRGATVLLLNTSGGMSLEGRVQQAEQFNADIFVSVHNNSSASNSNAAGSEMYYFTPFSQVFAATAARNVSGNLNTNNRGAKYSYYHVTLSSQFTSILAECGFMSNKNEYEKLIKSGNQSNIALGLADAISAAISYAYPGSGGTDGGSGGDSGSGIFFTNDNTSSSSSADSIFGGGDSATNTGDGLNLGGNTSDSKAEADGITLSEYELYLEEGESFSLKATLTPADADSKVTWTTSDKTVAKVSTNGKVTGVGFGTATITATTSNGEHYEECEVEVG